MPRRLPALALGLRRVETPSLFLNDRIPSPLNRFPAVNEVCKRGSTFLKPISCEVFAGGELWSRSPSLQRRRFHLRLLLEGGRCFCPTDPENLTAFREEIPQVWLS